MRRFRADLHVHTVLSPCAEYRMVPELIVRQALRERLDILGITDHNSGENAEAVMAAATGSGVTVLPGMEVESREGVHILSLFDDLEALSSWQKTVYDTLPDKQNDERAFGAQLVVDVQGRLVSVNHRLLIAATGMAVEEIAAEVERRGGLYIPAHVDRPANGLLGVLGLKPEALSPVGMEVSRLLAPAEAEARYPQLAGVVIIQSSDAHSLEDVGILSTTFVIEAPTVREISWACRGEMGRTIAA